MSLRVAVLSPLPPEPSGISDYCAELLPHLARHLEVELVRNSGTTPDPELRQFSIHSYREFRRRREEGRFNLCLYHLGNNPAFHSEIYTALLEWPGVVVLHEYMLHHLVRGMTLARGDAAAYLDTMRYCYGATGLAMARRALETATPVDIWSFPLFERAVDASLGLIVHNEATRRRVLASRPRARITTIRHHLSLDALPPEAPAAAAALRRRFGVPEGAFIVASYGMITPQKRLEVSLRAFARFRRHAPEAVYLLVGEVSPYYDLEALLGKGLGDAVRVTGRLSLEELLAAMTLCDVAVNLRHPTGGETSGTFMRLLGLGKAVIASRHGSFAEIPEDCCALVDVGEWEEDLLVAYLKELHGNERLRRAMGENARRHLAAHHTLEGSAAAYAAFLAAVAAESPEPFRAAPPLLASEPDDVRSALTADVGRAIVDLGIDERERELLGAASRALAELGLD